MRLAWIRALWRREDGSVTVIGALALPALVGFVALVGEFGHGLVTKTENQRIADLAAYAAAVAYGSTSSPATMSAVAQNVAALNGLPSGAVTASLTTSPRSAASQAVVANVSTRNMLLLAPVLGFGSSLPVSAKAYAQLNTTSPPCVLALAATGNGVTMAGGSSIDATLCVVASLNTLTVPCGTTITAQAVVYNKLAPAVGCAGGIVGALQAGQMPDPLAQNLAAISGAARATALVAQTGPLPVVVATGQDISFGYVASLTQLQAALARCAAALAGSTWTLTCPAGSTYNFGNITVGSGLTVAFNTAGSAANTYNIGSISNSGTALRFGPGTYNIARGLTTGGGSTTSFGAGSFSIGSGTSPCNGAGFYAICNNGTSLTFDGPSAFSLAAGLYNAGGSALALGNGTGNSFNIGPASDGNAVSLGGGSTTTFADATGSGLFQLVGNFKQTGGACTTIGAAAQHDINGSLSAAGGMILGAGVYSVTGYAAFGGDGGGDVTCNGASVGVIGSDVTFFIAGLNAYSGGSCNGFAFCVASGFSNVVMSAPSSGTYRNLAIIGPTVSSSGALFTDGSSNTTLAGAVYFPSGPLNLAGNATISKQVGQCLQLVASQISLTGGTKAIAASCFQSSGGTTTAMLVQ